jgi:hypothetical protein
MIRKHIPEGSTVLDLAASRAARAEQRAKDGKGAPFVKLAAGYVEVKAEIPLAAAFAFKNEEIEAGLRLMLADPADGDKLVADGLSSEDLAALTQFIAGVTPGN